MVLAALAAIAERSQLTFLLQAQLLKMLINHPGKQTNIQTTKSVHITKATVVIKASFYCRELQRVLTEVLMKPERKPQTDQVMHTDKDDPHF